ncbi:MAG: hypothetical protein JSW58_08590 [Candidatus Latescibacterota bacterium]|nr:MAG: hypothetical protein JSW58_08590 [Candidatus Latescibacterota bacterium]
MARMKRMPVTLQLSTEINYRTLDELVKRLGRVTFELSGAVGKLDGIPGVSSPKFDIKRGLRAAKGAVEASEENEEEDGRSEEDNEETQFEEGTSMQDVREEDSGADVLQT